MAKKEIQKPKSNFGDKLVARIFFVSAFITLFFNVSLQDPFNSPKMWILLALASFVMPYLYKYKSLNKDRTKTGSNNIIYYVSGSFILSLFISTLMTDVRYTGFFGTSGRRLGFLTYLSLTVVLTVLATYADKDSRRIYYPILFLSTIMVGYGYLQGAGLDFISWNNPYNSIILTFGNPNYASAFLAILASVLMGGIFDSRFKKSLKTIFFVLVVFMLVIIRNSNSRQGLIAFSIAILVQFCFVLYFKRKLLGQIFVSISVAIFGLILLAMLQIGPLADLIYKQSVSIRGYYWRAAIEMFRAHPIFGVGIDDYGNYFKEFRESDYSLKYGFEITSSNAHNVPLQLLSTGGLFVGISYLALNLYVAYAAIKLILGSDLINRNYYVTLFSAWIAFQAQSIISIDNIGLTVWGWIFAGLIVGIYRNSIYFGNNEIQSTQFGNNELISRQIFSYFLVIAIIILCSFPYRSEQTALQQRSVYNPKIEENRKLVFDSGEKLSSLPLVDPTYQFFNSNYMITSGFEKQGFQILDELILNDPRNLDYLNAKAGYYEQLNKIEEAIVIRLQIKRYDPWNARNLLSLGLDYKKIGDFTNMNSVLLQISNFAGDNAISIEAAEKLINE